MNKKFNFIISLLLLFSNLLLAQDPPVADAGDDIIVSYLLKRKMEAPLKLVSGKFMFLPEGDVGLNKHQDHFSMRWNVVQKFKNIGWTE